MPLRTITATLAVASVLGTWSPLSTHGVLAAPATASATDATTQLVTQRSVTTTDNTETAGGDNNDTIPVELFRVNLVQAPTADGGLDIAMDQLVGVHAENGTIMFITDASDKDTIDYFSKEYAFNNPEAAINPNGTASGPQSTTFVLPGFFDLHVHAPQFANIGLGYSTELLPWLNSYTFPLEESFATTSETDTKGNSSPEERYVRNAYERVVSKMLTQGTTTASYYATVHPRASFILAQEVARQGQRAYVGKVNTDIAPNEELNESMEESLAGTVEFIELVKGLNSSRVTPVISPRYGLGVSWDLLVKLGDLAREHNLPVQTHIDENTLEVEQVTQRFPNTTSYADLYAKTGLFNVSHITLGHCVHTTDDEVTQMLQYPGVGCAPCPLSNFALNSGISPIRHFLNRGLPVGLGTDAAGGYSSSPLESMRAAISASKALYFQHNRSAEWAHLDIDSALYLATKGSADVMGLGDKVGVLKPGYQWDALFVDISANGSPTSLDYNRDAGRHGPAYTTRDLVSKFIYQGDDRNIVKVWVDGNLVKDISN